jgi:hypothetical protein
MPYIGNIVQDFSVNTAMLNTDSVTSIKIDDGTIVNADINASAAIAGTKIDPNFGTQTVTSSYLTLSAVNPNISFTDTNDNPDFKLEANSGQFKIIDTSGSGSDRLIVQNDGTIDVEGNLDANGGLDVTGAITGTGDLTIDTNTLHVDSANNRVGIGTTSPNAKLYIAEAGSNTGGDINLNADGLVVDNSGGNTGLTFKTPNTASSRIAFGDPEDNNVGQILYNHSTDDLTITAADNIILEGDAVGIGTTSPDTPLHVERATTGDVLKGLSTNNNTRSRITLQGKDPSGNAVTLMLGGDGDFGGMVFTHSNHDLGFATNNAAPQMTLDTSGNVGIGTSSPDTLLHLAGADTAIIRLENTDTSLGSSQLIGAIEFEKQDPTGAGVGIAGAIKLKSMSSVGQAASMFFTTSNSSDNDQTRMTIDFDGRVLIGGATSINASTNADDLQVGASSQSNQTGITLGSTVASSLRFMDAANDSAGYIQMNHGTDELTIKSNSGGIIFNVSSVQVATIDSTGLRLVSGKGINFNATSNTSGVTSELLDDYEEGTWTPQMGGSNASKNHANYVKIGRFVHLDFDITNNSGSAHTSITNLPFTAVEYSAWHVAWVSNSSGGSLASSDLIGGLVSANTLSARGAGGNTNININNNVRMIGSATYQTAT